MHSSLAETGAPLAQSVRVDDDAIVVDLVDGRAVSVPLSWYPRLVHGTPEERSEWELIGRGHGIHWPRLDEDVAVEDLLDGRPSRESQTSLRKWLESRAQ